MGQSMDHASQPVPDGALTRPVALSGPMGSGKTTVGRVLADRLGVPFADVDLVIAREAGRSVTEIFASEGEAGFRARERAAVTRLLEGGASVIALGGGAVSDLATRRMLVERAFLVTLDAPVAVLVARLGADGIARRPLLAGKDPEGRLRAILDVRAEAYAEAHLRVATAERAPDSIVDEIVTMAKRDPVAVPLGARTYRVEVGPGVRRELSSILQSLAASEVLLVTDEGAWNAVGAKIEEALRQIEGGVKVAARVVLPSGEIHKTIGSVERIWDAALQSGIDRRSVILAVGGGVVGDVAGFAAATLLRGIRFVQVPTTLLAMVDASVGGKTAVDREEGKNLVGAFHQPSAVVADTELLATLPPREIRSGLAEVVKTALIGDRALLASLEAVADRLSVADAKESAALLAPLVRASIAYKARVVASDEREVTGARAALNFGHTVGHALEAHAGYDRLTHGEAVALGMIAALRIGIARGITPAKLLDRTRTLLSRLGLPVDLDAEPLAVALPRITSDKKREGNKVAFVLLVDVGRTRLERLALDDVQRALLA